MKPGLKASVMNHFHNIDRNTDNTPIEQFDQHEEGIEDGYIEPHASAILEDLHDKYLYDNVLEQHYDFAIKENPYLIKIVMYKIIENPGDGDPFLKFAVQMNQSTQSWDFPEYSYMPEQIANRTGTDEFFLEKFKEELVKIIPETTFSEIRMDRMLKGILEYKDVIYTFFDMTDREFPNATWGTIHELYNLRKIGFAQVSHSIEDLFYHNDYLIKIKGSNMQSVGYPYVLFLCDKTEGFMGSTLINVEKSDSIRLPRVKDERIGDFFWFSSIPIQEGSDPRKFIVFIHKEKYFKKGEK